MLRYKKLLMWAGGLTLLAATTAPAAPTVTVGTVNVLTNKANNTFAILVTGGDPVQGLNLNLQVGNGVSGGPRIVSVDIVGLNTLFNTSNTGQGGAGAIGNQFFEATTTTNAGIGNGTVSASGTLALVTIDTTGFGTGDFNLLVTGTLNGNSNFGNVQGNFTNGTLHVVTPEPAGLAIGLIAAGTLACRRRNVKSFCL